MTYASTIDSVVPRPLDAHKKQQISNRKWVRGWLYITILTLFALVLVGGATRLTDSGLSITEWKPIHGVVPPLSAAQWDEEFQKYRQIPEYQQINKGMSLDEFKVIYWWEWAHRFLARGLGLIFAVPLAFFWITKKLEPRLKPKMLVLLALGGLQGFIGWWMVSSGLSVRTDVSQYRLDVHLTLASLIFAGLVYCARSIAPHSQGPALKKTERGAMLLAFFVLLQIYFGGLVAGLDAGLTYTTWPLMDGSIIPQGLGVIDPLWRNAFENPLTVQFIHRMTAYALLACIVVHVVRTIGREGSGTTHARRGILLLVLALGQAGVGITTLLMQVPIQWALMHQGYGLILLAFATAHWRGAKGSYRLV